MGIGWARLIFVPSPPRGGGNSHEIEWDRMAWAGWEFFTITLTFHPNQTYHYFIRSCDFQKLIENKCQGSNIFLWVFLVFPIRWPHHPTNGGRLIAIFSLEPYISLVIKFKCNDFSKFIGNKCQITNLLDVTDFQKLIGSKCRSSFISYGLFLHLAPSSTNGGRMRECLFHFPLSWQRN